MVHLTRSQLIRRAWWTGIGLAAVVAVSACSVPESSTETSSNSASSSTPITVAIDPTFPPLQSTSENGDIEGFEIDLINAIAEAAGVNIEMIPLSFREIIPALEAGTVDASISAMTITPERERQISFSRPYLQSGLAIVVPSLDESITDFDDLNGKRIGIQRGTTGAAEAAEANAGELVAYDNSILALQGLATGEVDAVINDIPVNKFLIRSGQIQGIRSLDEPLTVELYGIATQRNSATLQQLNQGLTTILEDGTYDEIYHTWFDTEPPELPSEG